MPIDRLNIRPQLQLLDFEKPLKALYAKAEKLLKKAPKNPDDPDLKLDEVLDKINETSKSIYSELDNWQRTMVARHPERPFSLDLANYIFDDFVELHGDRNFRDDQSTICGMAWLDGKSVMVIGQQRGRGTEDNLKRNFGMPQPEGYRKALRVFELAAKFDVPIITFIDTPGAFPGLEGEERSQGEAIARNLKKMAGFKVPIISIVIGEGGSGGALGIGVANHVMMLENSIYSVISPESCASILWRDANKKELAASALKNDASTSLKFGIIDEIVPEPVGGAHRNWRETSANIKSSLIKNLERLGQSSGDELANQRIEKFASMGETVKIS